MNTLSSTGTSRLGYVISRDATTLEVLTTSQKLAHRIAHELKKAFGGKTSYAGPARAREQH